MTNIRVSYGDIETATQRLSAGRAEITERLGQLRAQIEQLVSSGFVTERASERFGASYARFTQDASQTIAHLDEIVRFLSQTAQSLRELDQQIAARIG
ncbi:WXG100 family type VII secretion target [Leucobacter sp. M11]|uniref:WXG100 family type VII secretion target n=1 Tax=Leucobacter sp. M11 TaxID=2993565 RepID=UPI002D7FACB1|nr:WXG100 family type VII secretion target [Leucobacter sp. M11]MEB4614674.1 WXG100 family type VII secretion target [Leucobacter sp. M11]